MIDTWQTDRIVENPLEESQDCGKIRFGSHNNLILFMQEQLALTVGLYWYLTKHTPEISQDGFYMQSSSRSERCWTIPSRPSRNPREI